VPSHSRKLVVLVHGWSVRNTNTYGQLPARLQEVAHQRGDLQLDFENVWLSKYVSFRDEVRLEDISRAFQAAVETELRPLVADGRRFACITHSTGGPVVRDWWHRFYLDAGKPDACPMSHLIMLAPANFGSALAQLGKGRLSRIRSWFQGVDPGSGVLEWLELGSPEAWALNRRWIDTPPVTTGPAPVFPFVLTGQTIDRRLYDHINAYTGEVGSDGVVRIAAANLNASVLELAQELGEQDASGRVTATFKINGPKASQRTAFAVIPGRSHSGEEIGILRSITAGEAPHPTVDAIVRSLMVKDPGDYAKLCDAFEQETEATIRAERVEAPSSFLRQDHYEIHDRHSMLIFRIRDDQGNVCEDFDFLLTAGDSNDPNLLPRGFLTDRQRNQRHRGTVTYYLNHDVLLGTSAIADPRGGKKPPLRVAIEGVGKLGFKVDPHRAAPKLFVRYAAAQLSASREHLESVLKPHQTTLVDIVLRRIVGQGVLRLTTDQTLVDFADLDPGPPI